MVRKCPRYTSHQSRVDFSLAFHGTYPVYTMDQEPGFIAAVEEAKKGAAEGGVPIGAVLVSKDGRILGRGRNMRVQKDSAILHVRPELRN